MPLTKRISKIFKSNDTGTGTARDDGQPRRLAEPSIPEEDDERDIIAVKQASLQSEITRLEGRNREQAIQLEREEEACSWTAQEINHLRTELIFKDREKESLQSLADNAETRLNAVQGAHSADLSSLSMRLRDLSAHLHAAQEDKAELQREKTHLQNENTALQNDIRALFASNQQYETWVSREKAIHNEQEGKIRDLEHHLTLALQPMDEQSRRAFNASVLWAREKKEFESEKATMTQDIQSLSTELRNQEEEHKQDLLMLEFRLATAEAALDKEKSEHHDAKVIIHALEVHGESLQEEVEGAQSELEEAQSRLSNVLSKLFALFGPNPTPRQFLFVQLFASTFPRLQQTQATCSRFMEGHQAEDLTSNDLDIPLAEASVVPFLNSICPGSPGYHTLQSLEFIRCSECKRHKLNGLPNDRNNNLIECPRWFRQNNCPTCALCTDCLKEKLKKAITEGWWYELDSPYWLKCPVDECRTPLEIGSVEVLVETIRDFSDGDVVQLSMMYGRALLFREALSCANPRPGLEAISLAIGLHQQLIAFGLLNDEFNVGTANDDVDAGEVLMGKIDTVDLQTPIFTKFFRRSETAVDCSICLESFHEIEIESQERWTQACEGYHGSWMSDMFSFPTRDALHCDHDINVCKQCLRRHLESQLELHGRNAKGRLTCPICNRVLSEQEVRSLGCAETVET
jgi:hypothetical protein